jgi:hypothetical protein
MTGDEHVTVLPRKHMMNQTLSRWQAPTITILNVFLRSERDAVASYCRIIDTRRRDAIQELPRCLNSHRKRVELLRLWIIHEGGYPMTESDGWESCGAISRVNDPIMDNRAALIALELGEIHVQGIYQAGLDGLDERSQRLISFAIVPEQVRMLKIINVMKYVIG